MAQPATGRSSLTLLDILRELDVSALGVLSGHLEAAGCCSYARSTCRALRDALDAGQTHVQLPLTYVLHSGLDEQQPSPQTQLFRKPCCSSVHVVVHLEAAPVSPSVYQDQQEEDDPEPDPGVEDLLAWPFEVLPAHRRQQITRLVLSTKLCGGAEPGSYNPLLPRALARLGPLLPALTHLNISGLFTCWYNERSRGYVTPLDDAQALYPTLASAFPGVTSLTMCGYWVHMEQLAHHLGDRMQALELGPVAPHERWRPGLKMLRHLPGMKRLQQLSLRFVDLHFERESYSHSDDSDGDDGVYWRVHGSGALWEGHGELQGHGQVDSVGGDVDVNGGTGEGAGGADGAGEEEEAPAGGVVGSAGEEGGAAGEAGGGAAGEEGGAAGEEGGAAGEAGGWAGGAGGQVGQQEAGGAGGPGGEVEGGAAGPGEEGDDGVAEVGGGGGGGGLAGAGELGWQQLVDGEEEVEEDEEAAFRRQRNLEVFKELLNCLPPSLEQLRVVSILVPSRDGFGKGPDCDDRELRLQLRGGKVQAVRAGWVAATQELRRLLRCILSSQLGPGNNPTQRPQSNKRAVARVPLLEVQAVDQRAVTVPYSEHGSVWAQLPVYRRRAERVDVGTLMLPEDQACPPEHLTDLAVACRPQVVRLGGLEVRLRGVGAVSLRRGEEAELYGEQRRRDQRRRQQQQQQQHLSDGGWEGAMGELGHGCGPGGGSTVMGLEVQAAQAAEVLAAALGPLRRALAAAAAAARPPGRRSGTCDTAAGPAAARKGPAAAPITGVTTVPGLAVVPADSRCRSHRLVLLWGPFFAALGSDRLLGKWLADMINAGVAQLGWTSEEWEEGGAVQGQAWVQPVWRVCLCLPAVEAGAGAGPGVGAGAGAAAVYLVENNSAVAAAALCAAVAKVAAASGGCVGVVRLAGASLEEAVFRPCMSPVLQALWDGSAGSGLGERERLEKLFTLWRELLGASRVLRARGAMGGCR